MDLTSSKTRKIEYLKANYVSEPTQKKSFMTQKVHTKSPNLSKLSRRE